MSTTGELAAPIPIGTETLPPFVRLPDPAAVFARRAERCRSLAASHPLAAYLRFIADLAAAQCMATKRLPAIGLPAGAEQARARARHLPPLDRHDWRFDGTWLAALAAIIRGLAAAAMPAAARRTLERLARQDEPALIALGDRLLRGTPGGDEAAAGCFVHAALQVAWTQAAAALDADAIERLQPPGLCPVCGSRPVASVVHASGMLQSSRFLSCALCSSEWHYVRVKCPTCTSTKGIAYQRLEGSDGAVKAETCDTCGTYTKIFYLQKNHRLEPFADDLASYALDVLLEGAGWRRASANPFLVPSAQGADEGGLA